MSVITAEGGAMIAALNAARERIANRVPLKLVHGIAALIFAVLGGATLLVMGEGLGF